MACAEAIDADALYEEARSAEPYARLSREDFDAALDFVATGGYALRTYDRFAKIRRMQDGRWRIANPKMLKPDSDMPAFESKLTPEELQALAAWLAAHK